MTIFECLVFILVSVLSSLGVFTILIAFRKKLPDNFPYPLVCGIASGAICLLLSIVISN